VRSNRAIEDEFYLALITREHELNYCAYGSRRMWKHLKRMGVKIGRDRVRRLMSQNGIAGAKNRCKTQKTTIQDTDHPPLVDHVNRDFDADQPNHKWVADFTYLRSWETVAYFSFVIDAFSRRVVGWQFARHMRTSLVLDALKMALSLRKRAPSNVRLIHHSDRGSQYTSEDFTQTLADHDVLASVGSTGDAYDNSMAESFVDSFKTELIKDRIWKTAIDQELAIVGYIDWFNNTRLHGEIGDIPPEEHETTFYANQYKKQSNIYN
jgi:putative transposase